MPERSHLSGLHGAGRRQVMQGRETRPTAGAAPSGGAAGYLAVERCCVAAISTAASPGLSSRPACHPLAVVSQRTKAAMKAAKARGVTLGGLRDKGEELYSGKQKNALKDSVACLRVCPGCQLAGRLRS
jgi:hypothetical protein